MFIKCCNTKRNKRLDDPPPIWAEVQAACFFIKSIRDNDKKVKFARS
nr:MAG TPA: hypothetical protein [Caudoviricetes sp.]